MKDEKAVQYKEVAGMANLATFSNESFGSIRIMDKAGDPWFVASDLEKVLDIQNIRQNLAALDEDEKGVCNVYTLGGSQEMTIVSESGYYALVFRSRKPEAKAFSRWVRTEVLPSIRKTGTYQMRPRRGEIQSGAFDPDWEETRKFLAALAGKLNDSDCAQMLDRCWRDVFGFPFTISLLAKSDIEARFARNNEYLLTSAQIGKSFPITMSARAVDAILASLGLQERTSRGYLPTKLGVMAGAAIIAFSQYGAKHSNYVKFVGWDPAITRVVWDDSKFDEYLSECETKMKSK